MIFLQRFLYLFAYFRNEVVKADTLMASTEAVNKGQNSFESQIEIIDEDIEIEQEVNNVGKNVKRKRKGKVEEKTKRR